MSDLSLSYELSREQIHAYRQDGHNLLQGVLPEGLAAYRDAPFTQP